MIEFFLPENSVLLPEVLICFHHTYRIHIASMGSSRNKPLSRQEDTVSLGLHCVVLLCARWDGRWVPCYPLLVNESRTNSQEGGNQSQGTSALEQGMPGIWGRRGGERFQCHCLHLSLTESCLLLEGKGACLLPPASRTWGQGKT